MTDNKELRELEEALKRSDRIFNDDSEKAIGTLFAYCYEDATLEDLKKALTQAEERGRKIGQTEFAQAEANTIFALMKDKLKQEARQECIDILQKEYDNYNPDSLIDYESELGMNRAIKLLKDRLTAEGKEKGK